MKVVEVAVENLKVRTYEAGVVDGDRGFFGNEGGTVVDQGVSSDVDVRAGSPCFKVGVTVPVQWGGVVADLAFMEFDSATPHEDCRMYDLRPMNAG